MEETYDYTNVAHIHLHGFDNFNDFKSALQKAKDYNLKTIVGINSLFINNPLSQWDNAVKSFRESLSDDLIDNILAIYVIDEPVGCGDEIKNNLQQTISITKKYFPNKPTIINFNSQLINPPNNVDWIAIDPYFNPTEGDCEQWDRFNREVTPLMDWAKSFDKPIVLIGQSFYYRNFVDYVMPSPCQQQWYYDRALSEPQVNTLLWFVYTSWNNFPNGENIGGAENHPEIIEFHKKIGKEIIRD